MLKGKGWVKVYYFLTIKKTLIKKDFSLYFDAFGVINKKKGAVHGQPLQLLKKLSNYFLDIFCVVV